MEENYYMDVVMVSEYLHVARSTVYRWVGMNYIPHAKLGTRNVFIKEQIDGWVLQNVVTPTELPELPTFFRN